MGDNFFLAHGPYHVLQMTFFCHFQEYFVCFLLQGTFDTKDAAASAHAGITQATAYYPYDPTLGQYQYDR